MINKYKIRFGLVGIFIMLSLAGWILYVTFTTTAMYDTQSCCVNSHHSVSASTTDIPIILKQDPVEPGNPDHLEPNANCATNPKQGQVACPCAKHKSCNPDGSTNEHSSCKSWCFKKWCFCGTPCA
jgi:hypothetical protein